MRNQRITDEQAAALLNGHAPEDREDLQRLAGVVGTLRLASFEAPPQPSAALAARLDLDRLAWVYATRGTGVPACDSDRTAVLTRRPAKGKVKTALGWFTGLGIAAQLALGAGAVSASAAGIGLAGALPPAAQEVFDTVVATVAHADELLYGGAGEPDSTAKGVTDDARAGVNGTDTDVDGPAAPGKKAGGDAAVQEKSGAAPAKGEPDDGAIVDRPGAPEQANSDRGADGQGPAGQEKQEKPDQHDKPGKSSDWQRSKETSGDAAGEAESTHGSADEPQAGKNKNPDTVGSPARNGAGEKGDADEAANRGDADRAEEKSGKEHGGKQARL